MLKTLKLKMLRNLMLNISSYAQHSVSSQSPPDPTHSLAILLTQVMGDLLTTLALVGPTMETLAILGAMAILGVLAILGTLAILDTLEILDTLVIMAILAMLVIVAMLGIVDILAIHRTVILQTLAISTIEDKIIPLLNY